jgi:hypothetical protein
MFTNFTIKLLFVRTFIINQSYREYFTEIDISSTEIKFILSLHIS